MGKPKQLGACVPYELKPDWPAHTGKGYELADCPDCDKKMWLGLKIKALIEAGEATAACMLCVIEKHGANHSTPVRSLTGDGNNLVLGQEGGNTVSNAEANEQAMKDELVEVMELMKPTPELADKMVASIHPDNYDASDRRLVEAVKQVINLEKGIGPSTTSELISWVEAMIGVGVANAVGFSLHIIKMLEDNPDDLTKLVKRIAKACMTDINDKDTAEGLKMLVADPKTALFLWGLYNEGIKQGMISGWRQHEIALIAQLGVSPETPEEVAK